VANIKSQIKRNKQNEKARQRNKAVKSSLRTSVRKFREAADGGDLEAAETALRAACRQLDKAASKGVIHKNQAANRKSAMARHYAELRQHARSHAGTGRGGGYPVYRGGPGLRGGSGVWGPLNQPHDPDQPQ